MSSTYETTPRGSVPRFLVPSVLGAVAFLFPVRHEGVITIPMAVLSGWLTGVLDAYLHYIVLTIIGISAVASVWVSSRPASDVTKGGWVRQLFAVNRAWLLIRVVGFAMVVLIVFKLGPEPIWADHTGQVVLGVAKLIFTIFIFASFLMPLLTDYGLMDLIGTLLSRIFRRAFLLPGRSCIDALASWMASAPVGVLITSQQFERGNYSGREAAVIATNFSVVSVPFCVIVANTVELQHLFVPYYATVVVCGLIAALITPRVPPLSKIPDDYSEAGKQLVENLDPPEGLLRAGMDAAIRKSAESPGAVELLRRSLYNLFDVTLGLMPPLMAIGTAGLIIAEYTPLFTWLSYPLVYVLELFRLPEAATAAPALLVGFVDMFLPAVLAKSIDSELTRFVIAVVSITQLIYMTEVGIMILKTRIPLSFLNLMQVFLLRTLICLPIAAGVAHWFVF